MTDFSAYANFTESEMRCRCGCGRADMDPDFMARLQGVRDAFKRPMVVTSGFRCPEHDRAVGGAGVHPTGHAADIAVSGEPAFRLLTVAVVLDMRGIGQKQHGPYGGRFLHLDDLGGPMRPRTWTYRD